MTTKLTITCTDFRPLVRNTLRGFATLHVAELRLTLRDIAVHEQANGSRWVALPARPMVDRDGVARRNDAGKIEYVPMFEFDDRAVRDAFVQAAVSAILEHNARAFDAVEAVS